MTGVRIGLLTGPVGVGKTTIAERMISLARKQGVVCGGFLAPAMLDDCGHKVGIWGVDVRTGERRTLAVICAEGDLGGARVGPYSFDGATLDWAVAVMEGAVGACDLLFVDEIGKLELWHGLGLAPILPRLGSGEVRRALVLVRDSLLAELQGRLGSVEQIVFQVSTANRADLPPSILESLA